MKINETQNIPMHFQSPLRYKISLILCVTPISQCVATLLPREISRSRRQDVLNQLIGENSNYNSHIPPDYEQNYATQIKCQFHVFNIDNINDQSMDFNLRMYFRQYWVDRRLNYDNFTIDLPFLEIDDKLMDTIWLPDTYFWNEKTDKSQTKKNPSRLMQLYRNGSIIYSKLLSVVLSCHMRLYKYPLDTQRCPMNISSYAYTKHNIEYQWYRPAFDQEPELQTQEFSLLGVIVNECTSNATFDQLGSWSCIWATFILKREVAYYMIHVYLPCILVVVLSWVTLWLDTRATVARISLGVLTVMAMTDLSSKSRSHQMVLSYVKAIDVYINVCLFSVISVLIEFGYVSMLSKKSPPELISSPTFYHPSSKLSSFSAFSKSKAVSQEVTEYGKHRARRVDTISRIVFPTNFLVFNIVYWLTYIYIED